MFGQLAAIIIPVFVCAGIGFLWGRAGRPFETQFVTLLVSYVGTPCLIGSTLTRYELDLAALGIMAGAAALAFAGFGLVGLAAVRIARLPVHSYLPALMFPNAGNMGLPLSLFAFGETGLALAITYFALSSVLQFTLGVGIAAGSFAPGRLLRLPLLYALAGALAFLATGTPVPAWLDNTLALLGGMTIPLMLIALGVSLARLRIASLRRSLALSLVRLLGGAAVGVAVGWALGLDEVGRGVLALQSAMPVAVFNYLFAQLYKREPEEVAGMVVLSTALSFASLPLLLLLVL